MKRWILSLSLLTAVVLGVLWFLGGGPSFGESKTGLLITEVRGDVQIQAADGQTLDVVQGETRVSTDQSLQTGEGGQVVLSLGDNLEITVGDSANVRVGRITEDGVEMQLDDGRVRANVKPGGPKLDIGQDGRRFSTEDGAFELVADQGHLAVQVERGSVEARGVDSVSTVEAGQRVTVLPDGGAWVSDIPKDLLLDVAWPTQKRTNNMQAVLAGVAEPGSVIVVSGVRSTKRVRVGQDGRFKVPVELKEGLHSVEISALSMLGQAKAAKWNVELDTTGPPIRGEILPVP